MLNEELTNSLLQTEKSNVRFSEPMKKHTTFKIGGPADVFFEAYSRDAFVSAVSLCTKNEVPFFICGAGSNLLVGDKGFRGVIIKPCSTDVTKDGDFLTADAGISLASLAKTALSSSLSGLEFASGIPGTLGGAVYMNAGAYGGEMKDVVYKTTYIDQNGETGQITAAGHDFGYRKSVFANGGKFIISTVMKLIPADKNEISEKMNDLNARRREKQPLDFPSAGSTFKRPEGYFAAKLIEDAGLKGYSSGGAAVSEKHAGFIINTGAATAADVLSLIEHIKNTVYKKFGVSLTPEVKLIGEF